MTTVVAVIERNGRTLADWHNAICEYGMEDSV
jgi:hypothetical protein